MIASLLLPLMLVQGSPPLGPVLPAGANASYVETCLAIQSCLELGKVDEAKATAQTLPRRAFVLQIRDEGLPPAKLPEVKDAVMLAIQNWSRLVPKIEVRFEGKPDLVMSFVEHIPGRAEGEGPLAASHFFSHDSREPRVEAVLALRRGQALQPTTPDEIYNEALYALGAYFGLAWVPLKGTAMGRSELAGLKKLNVQPFEALAAIRLLDLAETHRALAEAGKPVVPARPKLFMDPTSYRGTPVRQADAAEFGIQLTNQGNAPLHVSLVPDCTCLSARPVPPIPPGATLIVPVVVNTVDFTGDLRKRIEILSNDVEHPSRSFDFELRVEPLWEFFNPAGDVVVVDGDGAAEFRFYLLVADGVRLGVDSLDILGVNGVVSAGPWSGTLEEKGKRSGYAITVKLDGGLPPGRNIGNVVVKTSNPAFRAIDYGFSVQKGIVALPESVYFGEIARTPRQAAFTVTRPGKPFKVLRIESDNPHLRATSTPVRNGTEYQVTVDFDGDAPIGRFAAILTIHTDDKRQPTLLVPVQARIR